MDEHESDDPNGDGEGVWSPDIEQCFREALLLFPPCGRRKHILPTEDGGKMYGRNELIARHIMMRTGKSRTRKQVSSHIQVLARRKARADAMSSGASGATPSPSGQRSQSVGGDLNSPHLYQQQQHQAHQQHHHSQQQQQQHQFQSQQQISTHQQQQQGVDYFDVWLDRPIATQRIRLVGFCGFIEHRNHYHINNSAPAQDDSAAMFMTQNQTIARLNSPNTAELSAEMAQASIHPLASSNQHRGRNTYNPNNENQSNHLSQCASLSDNIHNASHNNVDPATGFIRHSYVKLDYRLSNDSPRQTSSKLERIDIGQIQDKFPELGGSDGLFQRGPPDAFYLVKFWADVSDNYEYNIDDQNSFFGFSSQFETIDLYKHITCSTKACSYGLQVVEKVEKIYGAFNNANGRYIYETNRSPMCEFMVQFIKRLRQLPRVSQMNSVLENFTVLQVITSGSSSDILLCLAYVFEITSGEQHTQGPQHHVYKLAKD